MNFSKSESSEADGWALIAMMLLLNSEKHPATYGGYDKK